MNCKCKDLKEWVSKEIIFLESFLNDLSEGSRAHLLITGKIHAYQIILEGLNN